ncbi:hypothetical protein RRG08_021699 [Elysia crispata]|uniref:Uncharacterized protein n=1 Tax=Elysia crispata TaxID=231223 RepID=A0AAE0ZZ48_9GAST|nr:hypothetical protein RRG08_021699 [Elysia crispata]
MAIIKEAAVVYKAPKRMKKRRQLDALVDNVKLPRHRKSSTSQELLDYNSDSSELEEFSLAGLSSRKAKIGLFMVTMACLSICLGLVWVQWHLRHEIVLLQEKLKSVQSPDQGKSEFASLQAQVKGMENSLKELKKSDGLLDMDERLRKVEATAEKLNQSVFDAQNTLKSLKLKALAGTIASLGSELKEGETAQSAKTAEFEERLSALEGKANQPEKSSDMMEKKNSVDAQFRGMLSQQIADVNETTRSGILSVRDELSTLQGRLSALESYTQSKESGLMHDEVETLVMALIQEKMNNLTSSSVAGASGEVNNHSSDVLSQLSEKVNFLTQTISSKADFAESMDLVSKGDFILFQNDTLLNFENVNRTVFALSTELDSTFHRLDIVDAAVLNMSTLVGFESVHADKNQEDIPALSNSNSASTTVSTIEEGALKTTFPAALSSGTSKEAYQKQNQGLQIEGIESAEDLRKSWETWPLNNGQISTDVACMMLHLQGDSCWTFQQWKNCHFNVQEEMATHSLQNPTLELKYLKLFR